MKERKKEKKKKPPQTRGMHRGLKSLTLVVGDGCLLYCSEIFPHMVVFVSVVCSGLKQFSVVFFKVFQSSSQLLCEVFVLSHAYRGPPQSNKHRPMCSEVQLSLFFHRLPSPCNRVSSSPWFTFSQALRLLTHVLLHNPQGTP